MTHNTPRNYRRNIGTAIYDAELSYQENLILWQRSLTGPELGSFAEDYRRGMRDTVTVDAYQEYLRRRPKASSSAKLQRCIRHTRGRYPKNCQYCDARNPRLTDEQLWDAKEAPVNRDAPNDSIKGSRAIRELPRGLPDNSQAESISA
jgi:hypothetical protein